MKSKNNKFVPLKIVCFGGGTGLSTLLRGMRNLWWSMLSAIVVMFDSGGSSGNLRDKFGDLPPSDAVRCSIALSDTESFWRQAYLPRFKDNHSPGNLLLSSLVRVSDTFQEAIDKFCQHVDARGYIIPVALYNSDLCVDLDAGRVVSGEVEVDEAMRGGGIITRVFLDPPVDCNPRAVQAIEEADVICIGPGSFYTSLLPNLVVKGVQEAIMKSDAPIIFITNLITEGEGMTHLLGVEKMVVELEEYLGRPVAKVIVNDEFPADKIEQYERESKRPLDYSTFRKDKRCQLATLWEYELCPDGITRVRHDSHRLANLVSLVAHELVRR